MAYLSDDELDAIAARVFKTRESTLEDEGRSLEWRSLIQTVHVKRHHMNVAVDGLPPSAFEPQPDDENGNEVWNAGQIVSHICHSQLRLTKAIGELVDYTRDIDIDQLDTEPELNRTDTLGAIKTATVLLKHLLEAIPDDADMTRTGETERFGMLGIRGWFMLMAIHERAHVRQLRELA